MNKRARGLGSGLDALLPSVPEAGAREVPTTSIRQNSRQPRSLFDEAALDELAASIREHGIIQPLIVSQREEGRYELIAGERRWRAAQRAQLASVPVIVRETTPQQLLELALIENVQRADLNPIEEARAYEALKSDFQLHDDAIAQRLGKSRVAVANTRRLLQLAPEAQDALLKNQITAGHGRALLMLKTHQQQVQALQAIVEDGLTVRDVEGLEGLVRELDGDMARALGQLRGRRESRGESARRATTGDPQGNRGRALSAEDHEVERTLEGLLSTPVRIARTEKDLRVTVVFHSDESLQAFIDALSAAQS
jgi:ParB family chromosome partitioning protein